MKWIVTWVLVQYVIMPNNDYTVRIQRLETPQRTEWDLREYAFASYKLKQAVFWMQFIDSTGTFIKIPTAKDFITDIKFDSLKIKY